MMVFELPSSSESALLCTSKSLSLFFDFCFVFFFSVRFCTSTRFVHSERKKTYKIFAKLLTITVESNKYR